jgi:hypothetical protein
MHHMELAFGFFSYLIDWFGFSSSTERSGLTGDNIGTVPIQG